MIKGEPRFWRGFFFCLLARESADELHSLRDRAVRTPTKKPSYVNTDKDRGGSRNRIRGRSPNNDPASEGCQLQMLGRCLSAKDLWGNRRQNFESSARWFVRL